MIKNIIFDMGNVIFQFDFDHLLGSFYRGEHFEMLKERIFSKWALMDDERMTHEEYKKMVLTGLSEELKTPAENVLERWEEFMTPTPLMHEYIVQLKEKGFKLYLLSNIPLHFVERQYMFPVLKLFDGLVFSSQIKLLKPDKRIFNYLTDKYSLDKSECFFIDDTEENVNAAEKLGIKSFLFDKTGKNFELLKTRIEALSQK